MICDNNRYEDEECFIDWVADVLRAMGITPTNLMCGMSSRIDLPGERLRARSLMVAALPAGASVTLQRLGLGDGRLMGCGLFVAHKGIEAVRDAYQEFS